MMGNGRSLVGRLIVLACLVCLGLIATGPILLRISTPALHLERAGAQAAGSHSFTVDSPIRLLDHPVLVLERGTISLVSADQTWSGAGGSILALLAGGAQLRLEDAVLEVGGTSGGTPDAVASALAPLAETLVASNFQQLMVERGTIRLRRPDGTTETLDNVTAAIRRRQGAFAAKGGLAFRGQDVAFDAKLGPETAVQLTRTLSLQLDSALVDLDVEGTIKLGTDPVLRAPHATISVPNMRSLARWLGSPWPSGSGLQDFRAEGQLELSQAAIAVNDAALSMDGNQATGALTLDLRSAKPSIDGTIAAERLDLTRYLVSETPLSLDTYALATGQEDRFSFPLVRHVDADLRISADHLVVPHANVGRTAAAISVRDGRLLADVAELGLASGGTASGQLSLDMTGGEPTYGLRAKFDGADAASLTTALFNHAVVTGDAETIVDLTASGRSLDPLMSSLSGNAAVSLPQGGKLGFDTTALASDALAGRATGRPTARQSETSIGALSGQFAFRSGIARAELAATTGAAQQISGSGTINFAARTMDLRVGLGGPVLSTEVNPANSASLTWLKVIGAWSAPSVSLITSPSRVEGPVDRRGDRG